MNEIYLCDKSLWSAMKAAEEAGCREEWYIRYLKGEGDVKKEN